MKTSIGIHTFTMTTHLNGTHAVELYRDFKRYSEATGDIGIIPRGKPIKKMLLDGTTCKTYPYFETTHQKFDMGVSWILRFSNYSKDYKDYTLVPLNT